MAEDDHHGPLCPIFFARIECRLIQRSFVARTTNLHLLCFTHPRLRHPNSALGPWRPPHAVDPAPLAPTRAGGSTTPSGGDFMAHGSDFTERRARNLTGR